jgi:predicted TIM-barrel fold metal-dependent hydrolase
MIIDAWAQHPTSRHVRDPIFDSLRRWTRKDVGGAWQRQSEMPVSATLRNMDEAGVSISLISAWVGPKGAMISNDEVAGFVSEAPSRLVGVGSVDISRPMHAVREIRRCVNQLGFKAIRVLPWLWELPPCVCRVLRTWSPVLYPGRSHGSTQTVRVRTPHPIH